MPNPTVAAGYPKALLDFAVSRGADRQMLIERSQISLDDLQDQDNRIALANYMALLKAGIELCNEPALSLLFGEAVKLQDISLVGLIGVAFDNVESVRRQVNRYAPLTLDADDGGTADAIELVRENGDVWMKFTGAVYVDNPLLTESGFARNVCGARELRRLCRHRCPVSRACNFPKLSASPTKSRATAPNTTASSACRFSSRAT